MKQLLKQMADLLALVAVTPAWLAYWAGALIIGRQKAFAGWSQAASLAPGLLGVYLRRAFYRLVLPRCGAGSVITFGTIISHPGASIGQNAYVGAYCVLGDVTLEDDVLVGSHVSIINGGEQHGIERIDICIREQPGKWPRITIGRDAWIGDRSVVLADVGKQCVVGAGSVVTKALPDYAIAVGVPARIVRYRNAPPANQPVGTETEARETSPSVSSETPSRPSSLQHGR